MNKAIRPLAAAAIAALALTGCTSWLGAGAHAGGVRIADETVVQSAQALGQATGATSHRELLVAVAADLARGEAVRQVVQSNGIEVTDAEKAALLGANPQMERVIEAGAGPWWDAVATTTVAMGKMDGKRLQQGIEGVDVEVNPRYGNWNPNSLGLVSSNLSTSIEELQLAR